LTDLLRGPWNKQETENYLAAARYPLRLSCVGSDGFPRVVSLWYSYEGGHLMILVITLPRWFKQISIVFALYSVLILYVTA
jgi:nitroimidazol reductase NimA-like FMN-containing flavoprotein (pyridoxamine 5'-phosphate oxidase superfamily)